MRCCAFPACWETIKRAARSAQFLARPSISLQWWWLDNFSRQPIRVGSPVWRRCATVRCARWSAGLPPKIRCTALSRAALGQPSRPKSRRNGVNRGLRCAVAYALSVFQTFSGKDSIKLFEGAKSGSSRASDHCHSGLGRQAVGMWPWHEWSLCLSVLAMMTYLDRSLTQGDQGAGYCAPCVGIDPRISPSQFGN